MDVENKRSFKQRPCKDCGELINARAEVCPKCGVRLISRDSGNMNDLSYTSSSGKNKLAAALFAIFLGSLGIHKFYLGQVILGLVYLLLCWTAIPGIVGIIEGILFIAMSNYEFEQKYGRKPRY